MDDPAQVESPYSIPLIVSLVVLLCFSMFFSACEMAFSSLNRIKMKNMLFAAVISRSAITAARPMLSRLIISTILI